MRPGGASGLAMEIDGDRLIGPEPLDALDVLERALRPRRSPRIRPRRPCRTWRAARSASSPFAGDGVGQPVLPGADDLDDPALELGDVDLRRLAVVAADDELHPHQRAFREVGIERDDAAVVGLGQQRADALAHAWS